VRPAGMFAIAETACHIGQYFVNRLFPEYTVRHLIKLLGLAS